MLTFPYGFFKGGGGSEPIPVTADLWGHWDASLGVTKDGSDNVSQWDDQSGNGNHFTQGTGADQPLYKSSIGGGLLNDKPVINFHTNDGTYNGNYMVQSNAIYNPTENSAGSFTMLIAIYRHADAAGQAEHGVFIASEWDRAALGEVNNPADGILKAARSAYTMNFYGVSGPTGHNGNVNKTWDLYNGVITDGEFISDVTFTANNRGYYMEDNNVVTLDCTSCGAGGQILGGTPPYSWLNKRPGGSRGGVGPEIAEIVIYNVELSSADRDTMRTYLNDKYDVY